MITNIVIKNFKTLETSEFDLGAEPVVLIGPNNSGKTSILQALTMWHHGVEEWCQHYTHRKKEGESQQPRGVSISLNEFHSLITDNAKDIWHEKRTSQTQSGTARKSVKIEIDVTGVTENEDWDIKTEFIYRSRPTISCGPSINGFRKNESPDDVAKRWRDTLPPVAFLQPMSGMSEAEDVFGEIGSLRDRLGKGKTADVLRNICYLLAPPKGKVDEKEWEKGQERWEKLSGIISQKFPGVRLNAPEPDPRGKGKIKLTYHEYGKEYDLSSAGRGFHQTLLLLAFLYWTPGSIVLLDEPDAHLEVIRQRDNFSMYSKIAEELGSQLIIASHSEIVMREADPTAVVRVINGGTLPLVNKGNVDTFAKLLTSIGADKIAQAVEHNHIVFLEGRTDWEFLALFAEKLFGSEASEKIRRANLETVGNVVDEARKLFHALKSAVPNIRGFALFDLDVKSKVHGHASDEARDSGLNIQCWERFAIENYLLLPDVLRRHVQPKVGENADIESAQMDEAIKKNTAPAALKEPSNNHWLKTSMKEYINIVFVDFYHQTGRTQQVWNDSNCYKLAQHMEPDEIPDEVRKKILHMLKVIDPDYNPKAVFQAKH